MSLSTSSHYYGDLAYHQATSRAVNGMIGILEDAYISRKRLSSTQLPLCQPQTTRLLPWNNGRKTTPLVRGQWEIMVQK